MSYEKGHTVSFDKQKDGEDKVKSILHEVHAALQEKGYNSVNQLVGFLISGDPAYITSHNEARNLICKVDRDEIMEVLLRNYLQLQELEKTGKDE